MKSKIIFASVLFVSMAILFGGVARGAEIIAHLRVSAPNADLVDVPVHAVLELPGRLAGVPLREIRVKVLQLSDRWASVSVPGQLVLNDKGQKEIWWVIPRVKANSTSTWTVGVPAPGHPKAEFGPEKVFSWQGKDGDYLDLLFGGRKVTRYMYAYDTSSPQRTFETYKPLHHVFDAQGKNLLTNGPDGEYPYTKGIKYPHHRGIFIGWNRLEFGGQRFDLWHMSGVAQVHQKFLEMVAGPVLARSKSLVHWNDKNGEAMIAEQREVTVFRQSEPTVLLLEFHTKLKAVRGDVFLNGDPEHAGFQYRAHDDVAKGGKEVKATYLFHKDGIDPKKNYNLPWAAMSYGLNDRRYSVQHMNHPGNPEPTIYSAYRDYGRFGAFFKKEIAAGKTLTLRYRIWVGLRKAMPKRQAQQRWVPKDPPLAGADRYSAFVDAPKVEVLSVRTP